MRIGIGYDVHRLVEDRKLIIGGVNIPWTKGLLGHSDADVLIHAIMDALLGAAGLGDIGQHFPDTDESFKDASSMLLLKETAILLRNKGYNIVNIDAVIMAQKPKLMAYLAQMIDNIAGVVSIDKSLINIKATTTEKLGFVGREEGMAAQAVALINNN